MDTDIRTVKDMNGLIAYLAEKLEWKIDLDDFEDIEDITYDFDAKDIGLKEEAFAKIVSLRQLPPLVDGQKWGIFCVEFDSKRFEVTALRKILSGLIPKRRNSAEHAVWKQKDLLFICFWGNDNERTIGLAHFEDSDQGLPQIKMISCCPAVEDFTQIAVFENRLKNLKWPSNYLDHEKWQTDWSSAFVTGYRQTIKDSSTLTVQLAAEAQEIKKRILAILDIETSNGYVHLLYEKFKNTLIHDMTESQFADMYAQTVVYGLFSARCMDKTQDDFSAAEAIELIPNTNPFLKSLMKECLGSQNNSKLAFDELEIGNVVELLLHTKTDAIIQDFNRQTGGGREDPVIHFYEEFLTAYDKSQKVQRGVFYTPQPVVKFIVNAVDYIIKNEFGYEDGLASTDNKTIKYIRDSKRTVNGTRTKVEDTKEVPAIQILDPATGTGTFLRETILRIYENFKNKNRNLSPEELKRKWNAYVPEHLLPRINGFELMMAPYAVAHMKLAMVLKDTGYDFNRDERLRVYLTNTLEEPGNSNSQLALWDDPLASESITANQVKKDEGINIFIGNPPYSCESANNGDWIQHLMEDFKKEPGSNYRLQEQNYKAINDDYVKFMRLSMKKMENSDNSILAFILPHGFLDNPTFRGMRWKLLCFFSKIFIIELHGDTRRRESNPIDGGKDENVFDIQQGVCIFIGIKAVQNKTLDMNVMYRKDIFGIRENKYKWLSSTSFSSIDWNKIESIPPYYFFSERRFDYLTEYNEGFSVLEVFQKNVMGVATARDAIVIATSKEMLARRFKQIADPSVSNEEIIENFFQGKSSINGGSSWNLQKARKSIDISDISTLIQPYCYRPFDKRYIFYSPNWIDRDRKEIMTHFIRGLNLGLCLIRINRDDMCKAFISDSITDKTILSSKDNANVFPLYLYDGGIINNKSINFNQSTIDKIEKSLGLKLQINEGNTQEVFTPENLLDYIYSILYSPSYRKKYSDFLKSEFPRIPYPKDKTMFWRFVSKGKCLRQIHLMNNTITGLEYKFIGDGDNRVEKVMYKNGAIYINKSQFFINVTENTWNAYIAGYQPLQKWLKDRKGEILRDNDIIHYQNIIKAIEDTLITMREIDALHKF